MTLKPQKITDIMARLDLKFYQQPVVVIRPAGNMISRLGRLWEVERRANDCQWFSYRKDHLLGTEYKAVPMADIMAEIDRRAKVASHTPRK